MDNELNFKHNSTRLERVSASVRSIVGQIDGYTILARLSVSNDFLLALGQAQAVSTYAINGNLAKEIANIAIERFMLRYAKDVSVLLMEYPTHGN